MLISLHSAYFYGHFSYHSNGKSEIYATLTTFPTKLLFVLNGDNIENLIFQLLLKPKSPKSPKD